VQLSFATRELRQLCEDEEAMKQTLRTNVADVLRRRLADLSAASNMADLVAFPPIRVTSSTSRYGIELCDRYFLMFHPNHRSAQTFPDGEIDWTSVSRVQITGIEQHGES